MDKGVIFRFFVSVVLAGAAVTLFLLSREQPTTNLGSVEKPASELVRDFSETLTEIDHEVDSVLAEFEIEKSWCRRREFEIPSTGFARVERRVAIPRDVVPVLLNHRFNSMARRYNGRAVASENVRENTVTIHIELEGYIIQTIILKHTDNLKRGGRRESTRRT